MNSFVKTLLLLLALPLLAVIFLILLIPLLTVLLIWALLLPSGRGVRFYRFVPGRRCNDSRAPEPPEDEDVLEAECTVTDAEEEKDENKSSGKPPELEA